MDKLKCPCCSKEITFLSFIKAPSPWHMGCSDCGAKLRQNKFRWSCLLIAFFLGAGLGVSSGYTYIQTESGFIAILVFVFGLVLFEILGFKYLPKFGIGLEARNA